MAPPFKVKFQHKHQIQLQTSAPKAYFQCFIDLLMIIIGKPGMLQSMGSQRVGHDWATELNWMSTLTSAVHHFCKLNVHGNLTLYPQPSLLSRFSTTHPHSSTPGSSWELLLVVTVLREATPVAVVPAHCPSLQQNLSQSADSIE